MRSGIRDDYFEWLYRLMCGTRYPKHISYRRLLMHLHIIDFRFTIPLDENRAENGINMRYRYALFNGYEERADRIMRILDGPCSVLEMMVALAIHCEEDIMDDPEYGDRTTQWFWGMIGNLGLGSMTDDHYDEEYVNYVIERLLDRKYKPNGEGGLFTIYNCKKDLRKVEIWRQLGMYLNTFT